MPSNPRLRPLPLRQIRLTDPFWTKWQRTLVESTLPTQYARIVETGRISNFRRAAGAEAGEFEGLLFNDSDVYKWLEACAYGLMIQESPDLRRMCDDAISAIAAAQMEDGYINTYLQLKHPAMRLRNLNTLHEMYCIGHLIEAGVAWSECLGDARLLEISERAVAQLQSVFGPGKRRGYCGHQEIELALIQLANHTGNESYREFAYWMIEERGRAPHIFADELADPDVVALSPWAGNLLTKDGKYNGEYCQDHAPIRDQTDVVGHAVRAMYFAIAGAHMAADTKDETLMSALERQWDSVTKRRMYVTGGIGPSAHNEGFTTDFDLPNLTAYAETCAACGLAFWGRALLEMTGNGDYADVVERAIYNGALAGISMSGDHYFYANPLESRGSHVRTPWFQCACCPPNIARLIGSMGRYVLSVEDRSVYVHIPAGIDAETPVGRIVVESNYPWSGEIKIRYAGDKPSRFALKVRIPAWADEVEAELPGAEEPADYDMGYAVYDRTWNPGDTLNIDFGVTPKWVEAHPRVLDNLGRVALTVGPLIYCAEEVGQGVSPQSAAVVTEAPIEPVETEPMPGIRAHRALVLLDSSDFPDELYADLGTGESQEGTLELVPYFAWNNRGKTHMQVWLRRH